ncbi:pyridoxamine 5'-phosphate oxidase family protein [Lachnospiraceae bacterium C1.1]|nr:pyridoxamine 5'-phosphate oxidase family protein [Lachnospiraceae bacterium C1.1]
MRRKDREITDIDKILKITADCKFLHMALFDGEYPYIVPLHYGYSYDENENTFTFYMHGAKEGHKLDLIKENPNVCIEMETDVEPVSGGDIPCKYGSTYASVIGRGTAELVEDVDEKIHGLTLLMLNQTGRRFEMDEKMAASVAVIKVTIKDFSAKARVLNSK